MEFHSIDEKLDFLENCCDGSVCGDEARNTIAALSRDPCSEVRMTVAEALFHSADEQSELLLLELSADEDDLVRCEACDSLQNMNSVRTFERLLQMKNDPSDLVRGYAAMSAAVVAAHNSECPEEKLDECLTGLLGDPSEWTVIAALYSLVLSGYSEYEEQFLKHLTSEHYQNRLFTLTLLDELADEKKLSNPERTMRALSDLLTVEDNSPALEKAEKILKKMNG